MSDRYVRNGSVVELCRFQCVYCRQKCSSFAILCAHEGRCTRRGEIREKFQNARRRHIGRTHRGANWNQLEAE